MPSIKLHFRRTQGRHSPNPRTGFSFPGPGKNPHPDAPGKESGKVVLMNEDTSVDEFRKLKIKKS
jgi:hypothetical protein